MTRTLTLTRESLADLTCDELSAVAGGGYTFPQCQAEIVRAVVETLLTGAHPTRTCTT